MKEEFETKSNPTRNNQPTLRKYLTESQVAKMTGLSVSTLRNDRARAGKRRIAYVKFGRAVRYLEDDVYAFLDSHTIPSRG